MLKFIYIYIYDIFCTWHLSNALHKKLAYMYVNKTQSEFLHACPMALHVVLLVLYNRYITIHELECVAIMLSLQYHHTHTHTHIHVYQCFKQENLDISYDMFKVN